MKNYDYPAPKQGGMAKQQLSNMVFQATRMYDVLDEDDRLPAWVLLKLNTAEDRLRAASEYIRYKANPTLPEYTGVTRTVASYGQGVGYGYPTIQSQVIENQPYLCVSYKAEKEMIQPLRLAAALVGGPLLLSVLAKAPASPARTAAQAVAVAMSVWSGWVWNKARKEMAETA